MSEIQQLPEECNMGFGAEETNDLLDNPNLAAAMKKMLELQLQVMVIPIVKRIVGPMMENMVRKVVKEELEQAQERFFTGEKWKSGDDGPVTQERKLELWFLEQVPEVVYTGEEIKGGGGNHLTVALVDPLTRSCVSSGPEASAKVELIVCSENDVDADDNFKQEESEDTRKPLLCHNHVKLKDGFAVLDNIKFKHKSKWAKRCKVILVARANLNGMIVKEAATEPFLVMDRRSNLYTKRYPPSLSDDVWRLREISRGSQLHMNLTDAKVNTVVDFLRLLNMNPDELKKILKISTEKFKVIVDHAKTCPIGKNLYLYNSTSSERKARVVFNVVGCLHGLLYYDKYIPIDMLSGDEKVDAHKTMAFAFSDLKSAQSIENESAIGNFVSQSPNANGANTSSSPRTEDADDRNYSPAIVVPTSQDLEFIENETSISWLASGSSNANGAKTSSSPRTGNASCCNLSPQIVVPTYEDVEPIKNDASASHLGPGSSKAIGANISSSSRTEDVEPIENEGFINCLASGPSNANAAGTLSTSRTDSISGCNFGISKTIEESDNALPSTVPRHLSPVYSFGHEHFNALDYFPDNIMDNLGNIIDYPIYSRSGSEDFGEKLQLFIEEHTVQRTTSGDKQMPGIHVPSSSMARRRWRMAIRIVALVDMQARKKQRLK